MTSCLATRRIAYSVQLCALVLFLFFTSAANAAIKITAVTGASNSENIGSAATDTSTPVIFGGVTGTAASTVNNNPVCSGTGLCNSCPATAINATPLPCNEFAITTSTELVIQFTATKNGYPILTDENKTTVIEEGTTSVTAGQTAEIRVTWGNLCVALPDANACNPSGATPVSTGTLYIGVSKDADDSLDDADDEAGQITVTVSDAMGEPGYASAPACGSGSTLNSVCSYSIQSGDEKAVLTDLGKINNFPTLSGINISAVRVFFERCNFTDPMTPAEFATINPLSNPVDLGVTVDASGIPQLEENQITGLTNGLTYCTKLGQVDQAMNVGLYTALADDFSTGPTGACFTTYLNRPDGSPYVDSCHVARPDEVLGVLSESCFIATAAYGSPWAIKVQTFRDFRNKFLLSNQIGKKLVKFYYKNSPKFAKKIARSNTARAITRGALSPLWLFARVSLKIGLLATTLLTFGLFASPFAYLAYRRKQQLKVAQ